MHVAWCVVTIMPMMAAALTSTLYTLPAMGYAHSPLGCYYGKPFLNTKVTVSPRMSGNIPLSSYNPLTPPSKGPLFSKLTLLMAVPKKKTSKAKTKSRRATWFRRAPNKHVKSANGKNVSNTEVGMSQMNAADILKASKQTSYTLTAARTTRAGWLHLPPTNRGNTGNPILHETQYQHHKT